MSNVGMLISNTHYAYYFKNYIVGLICYAINHQLYNFNDLKQCENSKAFIFWPTFSMA